MLAALLLTPVALAMMFMVILGVSSVFAPPWLLAINIVEFAFLVWFSVRYTAWLWRITEKK